MDRKNFFYRQLIQESELDSAFTDVENALKNLSVDHNLTGIVSGFTVTSYTTSPHEVTLAAGKAYSKTTGRRMNYAGGVTSLASVTLPAIDGEIKIISIFAEPVYTESDPRTDGFGNPVNFVKTESVQINFEASASGTVTSLPAFPALRSDQVLIADLVVLRDNGSLLNFDVTHIPITTSTVSPASLFIIDPRTEYVIPPIPTDHIGDVASPAGSIRTAIATLIAKNKQYQTANTLSDLPATYIDDAADVKSPDSHDAFGDLTGTFYNQPGKFVLKQRGASSVYVPTLAVKLTKNQELEGSGPTEHALNLNTNTVNFHLVPEGAYKVKNLTIIAPFDTYKVANSGVPNHVRFENVLFDTVNDPAVNQDKLFWNVQNITSIRYRKSYNIELKNTDAKLGNFVFGSRNYSLGVPHTNVDTLNAGNLTIDSQNGTFRNIRLVGTDVASPVLNITGDNNLIENLVIESPAGEAPMILISGNNNTLRNVFLHNFGGHATTISSTRPDFQGVVFTASAQNNIIEGLQIQGGVNTFNGTETDLAGVAWGRNNITSITDNELDAAQQPLADRVYFAGASSFISRTDSSSENEAVVEIWARMNSGTGSFRIESNLSITDNLTVSTDWRKYRVLLTGMNSETRFVNGSDNAVRDIIFAHPARYYLTNLGDIDLVELSGDNNKIVNLSIENLKVGSSALIMYRQGRNTVENLVIDGVENITAPIVTTTASTFAVGTLNGFQLRNAQTAGLSITDSLIQAENSTSLRLKDVNLDFSNLENKCFDMNTGLVTIKSGNSDMFSTIENCYLVDNPNTPSGYVPLYISSFDAKVHVKNTYVRTLFGSSPSDVTQGVAVHVYNATVHFENCEFSALGGRALELDSAGGEVINCTVRGDSNVTYTGLGIPVMRKQNSFSVERHLDIQDLRVFYGDNNLRTAASIGKPMMELNVDYTTLDGLVVTAETSGLTTTEILLELTKSTRSASELSNISLNFGGGVGCPPVALLANGLASSRIRLSNVSVLGYRVDNTVLATSLVFLSNATLDNMYVNGHTAHGTGTVAKVLNVTTNSTASNIKLFAVSRTIPAVKYVEVDNTSILNSLDIYYGGGSFASGLVTTTDGTPIRMTNVDADNVVLSTIEITQSLGSTQNDWSPMDWSKSDIVRINPTVDVVINGLNSTCRTTRKLLVNTSASFKVTLDHNNGSQGTGNKLLSPTGRDYVLRSGNSVWVVKDYTSSAWLICTDQNASLDLALDTTGFLAQNYTWTGTHTFNTAIQAGTGVEFNYSTPRARSMYLDLTKGIIADSTKGAMDHQTANGNDSTDNSLVIDPIFSPMTYTLGLDLPTGCIVTDFNIGYADLTLGSILFRFYARTPNSLGISDPTDTILVGQSVPLSGTGDSFSFSTPIVTLTDSAGLFTAAHVGMTITITGSTSSANDGTFTILSRPSANTITYSNSSGVAEAFPGTWAITSGLVNVTLPIPETLDRSSSTYLLDFTWSGTTGPGDTFKLRSIKVNYLDPGPRNY